jgi:hypothetical protein
MNMDSESLFTEARARITWGESPLVVREFLVVSGVPEADADLCIRNFAAERNSTIRKKGIADVCVGSTLIAVAAVMLFLIFRKGGCADSYDTGTDSGRAAGGIILVALYGIWRLIRGIFYAFRPRSIEESLSNTD